MTAPQRRVCVRAGSNMPERQVDALHHERAVRNRGRREAWMMALLLALQTGGEQSCGQLADALGLGRRRYALVRSLLRALERRGLVDGETLESPTMTGAGRRFYRRARRAA